MASHNNGACQDSRNASLDYALLDQKQRPESSNALQKVVERQRPTPSVSYASSANVPQDQQLNRIENNQNEESYDNQPAQAEVLDDNEPDDLIVAEEQIPVNLPQTKYPNLSIQLVKEDPMEHLAPRIPTHTTENLSTVEQMLAKTGGPRFFSEPQTIDKNIKESVSDEALQGVRVKFMQMREQLVQGTKNMDAAEQPNENQLKKTKASAKRIQLGVQLWVVDGFLEHKLSLHKLQDVAKIYQRIKTIPQGYNQACLWQQIDVPEYYNVRRPADDHNEEIQEEAKQEL